MVMRTNLKIYRMACPACGWSELFTIRAGFPALFIINLLTGCRLPVKCPECGGKLKKQDQTKFWRT